MGVRRDLTVRSTRLDTTNNTEWSASTGNAVTLLWRRNLRTFRGVVHSYDGFYAGGVAKAVARGLEAVARLRLSLREPYHADGDKHQNEERRAPKEARRNSSKRPFIHS